MLLSRAYGHLGSVRRDSESDVPVLLHERVSGELSPRLHVQDDHRPVSGLEYAFDCIGVNQTIAQIVQAVRPAEWGGVSEGGIAVLVGVPAGEAPINALDMLLGAKTLTASIGGSSRPENDFPEFVRWYKEGMLDLDALVTKRWTLDQINEGVEDLRAGNVFGRSIIEF